MAVAAGGWNAGGFRAYPALMKPADLTLRVRDRTAQMARL
jgi:hypothetical protein